MGYIRLPLRSVYSKTVLYSALRCLLSHVCRTQDKQKRLHDQHAAEPSFQVGERVFLYEPRVKSSKAYKFVRPYGGPYRSVCLYQNGAEIHPVDKSKKTTFEWHSITFASALQKSLTDYASHPFTWASRLQPCQRSDWDARHKNREM